MASPLTVLTGPARSGKTERLLAIYRAALRQSPPRSVLWLAPTHRSVADILSRLPGPDLPGCLSPGVLTFENFAGEVLAASGRPVHRLSTLMKRQLVRYLIGEQRRAGRLRHFAPVADTHGLVDLVAAFISELKRLEIWPEDFRRACGARGLSDKDRELVAIYEAYQERLREHQLYDAEGRFWSARDLLTSDQRNGHPPYAIPVDGARSVPAALPYDRLKLVVADGFTDFTRTQHEILAMLAARTEAMYVSLPLESPPRREDLFAKTIETLETLQRRAPCGAVVEEMPRRPRSEWPAREHLEAEWFQNPRQARQAPAVERIEILGASREQGEIEEIGRRIKRLLAEGCEHPGDENADRRTVRPGEIVVVFRSLTGVAPLVREVFSDLGIPFDIEASETLDETPLAAAVVAMLRMAVEDWPFRQLLAVLGNNYLQPTWPQSQEGAAALAAERAVRSLQIPAGAQALLAALRRRGERSATQAPADRDEESRSARRVQQELADALAALPFLARLHDSLATLPPKASQATWADALARLADDIGMLRAIDSGDEALRRRDQDTWACLLRGLQDGSRLFEKLGEAPPELTAAEFLALVIDLLRWQRLPRHHDDVGRVRVLSAASVRSLRVPYLFFAGLSERAFPSPDRHDRLYSEGEYRQLRQRSPDLPLPLRHERNQEEMLLFYEVLTRATRRLWLSYPALDAKAEPLLPSPYLREVERACGGAANLPHQILLDLSAVPRPENGPQSQRDFRLLAVDQALAGDVGLLASLPEQGPSGLRRTVLNGLALTRERAAAPFGRFEGMLAGDAARADVASRYGPQRRWTVSHLEQYALCPHKFFLEKLLRLEPLDELTLEPDSMQRGGLIHEVLAELHRRLNDKEEGLASPASWGARQFEEAVEIIVQRVLGEAGAEHDVQAALREIDRRTIRQWLQSYREQHERYDAQWTAFEQPPRPAHFEVSFGSSPGTEDKPSTDKLSTDEPWELEHEGEKLLFSGRIDRLDLGQRDGQQVFNVIDYKSGRVRSRGDEPPDGRQLQLELYSLAAQELLFGGQALPLHAGYWYVKKEGFKAWQPVHQPAADGWQASEFWRDRVQQVLEKVFSLVRGIRAAEFPMASLDEHCTSYCPFKTVCRVNQTRSLGKTWQPPEKATQVH